MRVVRTDEVLAEDLDASRRLADSMRSLMLAAIRTGAAPDRLDAITARVSELTELLGPAVRSGALRLPLDEPVRSRLSEVTLRSGAYSAFSVPLEIEFAPDGTSARAEFSADALLEGPLTAVHGGIVAWVFDVILGVLVQAQGEGAVTKNLGVSYLRPTPLGVPVVVEAHLISIEGRQLAVEGTMSVDGKLTARASGDFVIPHRMPGHNP